MKQKYTFLYKIQLIWKIYFIKQHFFGIDCRVTPSVKTIKNAKP
jgi:hypothetical protein